MNNATLFAVNVSETLQADFAMLRETPYYQSRYNSVALDSDTQHSFKFSAKTIDKLSQYIACRNYAPLCYELAHLCWVLVNTGGKDAIFDYFYLAEAVTARRMQDFFESPENCQCALPSASVELLQRKLAQDTNKSSNKITHLNPAHVDIDSVPDCLCLKIHQHEFIIHLNRANILAACMEWLVTILPKVFDVAFEYLSGKGFNGIQSFSSYLQKDVYDYLKDHLPPAKAQAKFQQMSLWLKAKQLNQFCDDNILEFWQTPNAREGSEKLTTLIKDVFHFEQALESAKTQQAHQYAQDSYELDMAEQVFESVVTHAKAQIDLARLTELPKLLSKQQAQRLTLLAQFPQLCSRFPLSYLRHEVLGTMQSVCIQAQRNKTLNESFFEMPEQNQYADLLQKLRAQKELNSLSYCAVMHILLIGREEDGDAYCTELLAANNELLNALTQKVENQTNATQSIDHLLQEPSLISACKSAYQQNNRQGFTQSSHLSNKQVYVDSALVLLALSQALDTLLKSNAHLFQKTSLLFEKYASDGCIFSSELRQRMMK